MTSLCHFTNFGKYISDGLFVSSVYDNPPTLRTNILSANHQLGPQRLRERLYPPGVISDFEGPYCALG